MSDMRGELAPVEVKTGNTGKIIGATAIALVIGGIGAYTYAQGMWSQEPAPQQVVSNSDLPSLPTLPSTPPALPPAPEIAPPPSTNPAPQAAPDNSAAAPQQTPKRQAAIAPSRPRAVSKPLADEQQPAPPQRVVSNTELPVSALPPSPEPEIAPPPITSPAPQATPDNNDAATPQQTAPSDTPQ